MKKRIISLMLVLVCALSLTPSINVFADEVEVEVENLDETENQAKSVEDIERDTKEIDGREIKIALLDTGVNSTSINEGRLLKDSIDDNGHGTIMADVICANCDDKVKILPINVFDNEGKCNVSKLVDGIYEAIDEDVDIINISASSEGSNKELEEAIRTAKEKGIYVVVSAGNKASDVTKFMPGYIEEAIVVSATEESGSFAMYSNFGRTIDYSATGTVKRGDTTYSGTSVAAANVSSYIAMILEVGKDVEQTLLNAKEGEGFNNYNGNGNLTKESVERALNLTVEEVPQEQTEQKPEEQPQENTIEPIQVNTTNQELEVAGGWYYDYWMVGSWEDFIDGIWNHGAHKFVLVNDVSISELWVIDTGSHFIINGNGHQLVNNRPSPGPMLLVHNGGVLTTENNLTLNGNNHRNTGRNAEGGSSCVDCINASFYANSTGFCNNWNRGYSFGEDDLGGGTGFNIVSENGTPYSAVGVARGCWAYNCDGAAFFVRNDDGRGATLECYDCNAWDCSWGFMTTSGTMKLERCNANASRSDQSRSIWSPYGGCGICFIGGTGSAYDCNSVGANYGIWTSSDCYFERCSAYDSKDGFHGSRGWLTDCECRNNSSSGVCCDGDVTIVGGSIHDNSYGVFNVGKVTMKNTSFYSNSTYDVHQDGTLCISGTTSCNGKGIYLPSGRFVTVNEALSGTNKVVLAAGTNQLGRLVVSFNTALGNGVLNRFTLSSIKTTSGRDGILRCGVGTNGALGTIVLSERYTLTYKANLNKAGISEVVPGVQYFYWKEQATLLASQRPTLTKNGKPYSGYSFKNWNTNRLGTGTAYTSNVSVTLSNDLTLYAFYVDDVIPTGTINVTPTSWADMDGTVIITALDEGSGLKRIDLYRHNLVNGENRIVATYNYNGENEPVKNTFIQKDEGEFIFIAKVYDKDGNVLVLTSKHMKIDKSNPQIYGLENTRTDWTNIKPVISVNATDYLEDTTYEASGVKEVSIIDDKGKTIIKGKDRATYVIDEKYEGTHTFTIRVEDNLGHETTGSITTHYDCTAPVMIGTESSSVGNSVYVDDNVIDQQINDYYTNSKNANDSSGIKKVVLYEYRNGKLTEVKNNSTRKEYDKQNTNNAFHEKYTIKEKDKDVEYYILEAYDFAGNKTTKKITSQRYLLTLMHTSIDKGTYVL